MIIALDLLFFQLAFIDTIFYANKQIIPASKFHFLTMRTSNPVWGAKVGRLKKVKVWLKDFCRRISKFANKLAEVHGNRTHLGRF